MSKWSALTVGGSTLTEEEKNRTRARTPMPPNKGTKCYVCRGEGKKTLRLNIGRANNPKMVWLCPRHYQKYQ